MLEKLDSNEQIPCYVCQRYVAVYKSKDGAPLCPGCVNDLYPPEEKTPAIIDGKDVKLNVSDVNGYVADADDSCCDECDGDENDGDDWSVEDDVSNLTVKAPYHDRMVEDLKSYAKSQDETEAEMAAARLAKEIEFSIFEGPVDHLQFAFRYSNSWLQEPGKNCLIEGLDDES